MNTCFSIWNKHTLSPAGNAGVAAGSDAGLVDPSSVNGGVAAGSDAGARGFTECSSTELLGLC